MANLDSVQVANNQATPPVRNRNGVDGGRNRTKVANYATGGTQSDADILRLFRVKSSDTIYSMKLSNDALSGMLDVNFGFYELDMTIVDGGNTLDDAQTLASALVQQEKRVGANSALGIETLGQPNWQIAGLSEDPLQEWWVAATLVDAGTASADIAVEMTYNGGD